MSLQTNFGNVTVEGMYEEKQVEWKIANFSNIAEDANFGRCESPHFPFANASWFFQMWPKSNVRPNYTNLYLLSSSYLPYSVEYNLGLKKADDDVEQLVIGNLEKDCQCTESYYMKRSDILLRKNELVPSDVLTITCILKRGIISTEPQLLNSPNSKKLIKLETLSENLKRLSLHKESCDVTLHVKDKEYKSHKAILIARSSVFAAMFEHDTSEKQKGIVTISDCDHETFADFLEFLYSGKLEELSTNNALHLYETSEKYNVQELKTFCSEHLMENLTVENLCDILIIADKYDDSELLSTVQDFFNNNLNKIFMASEWEYLLNNYRSLANKLLLEMSTKMKPMK